MIIDLTLGDIMIILIEVAVLLLILLWFTRRLMKSISFTVNINIAPAQQPLAPVSDPLNLPGQVGVPFSADLSSNVVGGVAPLTFVATGTPPDGLVINGSVISGTPTTAGSSTLSVSVSDSSQ